MHTLEKSFSKYPEHKFPGEHIQTVVVPNYIALGQLTALRFIQWSIQNPKGVVSLPTGKTPQFFIEWVTYYQKNWPKVHSELSQFGFTEEEIELGFSCENLRFVQIDEFFPISPNQTNSFLHYIVKFYFEHFGFLEQNALLINPAKDLKLNLKELFPDGSVDINLQYSDDQSLSVLQKQQKRAILELHQYADEYEEKIIEMGGIQFFLGGIGPDGHIGFNVRGSSHFSTTRLCQVNYETMAASASDLGGIQKNKLVITIGLGTITRNHDAICIIMAAGNAKAPIVKQAIEYPKHVNQPASVLHGMPESRFYITPGASILLEEREVADLQQKDEFPDTTIHNILCQTSLNCKKSLRDLTLKDLTTTSRSRILLTKLQLKHEKQLQALVEYSISRLSLALKRGYERRKQVHSLHTAPHHDDLILGIFPEVLKELESDTCTTNISILTSGFTAVTNRMFLSMLQSAEKWLASPILELDEFIKQGRAHDCSLYLHGVAENQAEHKLLVRTHRVIRDAIDIYPVNSWGELLQVIVTIRSKIEHSYPGQKDTSDIQTLKGALREFEEELLWNAHGLGLEHITHLRLGFYKGDIFNQDPAQEDSDRFFDLMVQLKPNRLSLALDPEGSGPDTHYKVLLAVSAAVARFHSLYPEHPIEIIGYRNVWNRFFPWEADGMLPLSLPELQVIDRDFKEFYFSQVDAPFPSPEYHGPFSEFSQQIWVLQKKELELLLGPNFTNNEFENTKAIIFYKLLSPRELIAFANERKSTTQSLY